MSSRSLKERVPDEAGVFPIPAILEVWSSIYILTGSGHFLVSAVNVTAIGEMWIPGIYQYTVGIQHRLFMVEMVAGKKSLNSSGHRRAGANGAKVHVPLMFTCSSTPCTAIPTLSFGSGAKLFIPRLPNVVSLVRWAVRTAPCYIPFISR